MHRNLKVKIDGKYMFVEIARSPWDGYTDEQFTKYCVDAANDLGIKAVSMARKGKMNYAVKYAEEAASWALRVI